MQDSSEQNYYIPDFSRGFVEPRGALSFSLYLCVCFCCSMPDHPTMVLLCCIFSKFIWDTNGTKNRQTEKRTNEQTNRQTAGIEFGEL